MHLVDTHQHLWDLRQFPYSWCAGVPPLNRSFSLDDYRAAAAGTGITKTVFMECDVDDPHPLAEAQHVQRLADANPLIAGIVASGRPESDGFRAHLEALASLPKLRGFRRVLHVVRDDLCLEPRFAENLRLLPDFGLTFDLCALPRQLANVRTLVERCPQVTFIVDHVGVPDVKARMDEPWRTGLARLAELPNVACKISGLVAYADAATWTPADLQPYFDHAVACFGWDRLVWGGDWPVCTLSAPLARWVEATHALTARATPEQRARLFHRNAERLYRV
ncbi:amidohydrolase family protein [Oleiharenicola sp. Vm1]|uniref:amidohydrolase family protein n=1 Tax=Oleiharenicola sp. Vm1 TaxID=3398393 RepID=UPI0039F601EE